ncbi:MAG: TIGR01212 family radical SAM protein [Lachnospiraceae bacterium]
MKQQLWDSKPYYSLNSYFQSVYGRKIYKIALDGGMTCPNRDGTIDNRGCIFCSRGGSGDFAESMNKEQPDIRAQITKGKERLRAKYSGSGYVAYFQSYTNTYAPIDYLRRIYSDALDDPEVVGISIATRPDCLSGDVIALLRKLSKEYPEKFIWVELGLQTIHRESIAFIRRGYDNSVFEEAVKKLQQIQLPVIVHIILGLPGETKEQMLSTIEYLNTFPLFGVKLQLLHVLEGTDLATHFANREFDVLTMNEYMDILIECLEHLNPETVVHRVTGDGPKKILIAPLWSSDKKQVLNGLLKEMNIRNSWQGKKYLPDDDFHTI